MNRLLPYVAVVAMAAALAGCNRGPGTNTANNNSGSSATPSSTVTTPSSTTDTSTPSSTTTTTTTSSMDTASSTGGANVVADTMTTGKVKAAIVADPGLKDAEIIVKTDGGVVILTGTAKSQDQITLASNLAQRQEGVNRVDNQVSVR
jgi:hypothetical protein